MGLAPHWRRAVIATSLATMVVSAGTVLAPGASAAGGAPTITLRQAAVNASSVTWSRLKRIASPCMKMLSI